MFINANDEQEWLRTFYEGTILIKGWNTRTKEILEFIQGPERAEIKGLLEDLGKKIGHEWAKNNRTRRIDTAKIQKWGDNLLIARNMGTKILIEEIRKINSEVDNILK